jgi:hypothetical protein
VDKPFLFARDAHCVVNIGVVVNIVNFVVVVVCVCVRRSSSASSVPRLGTTASV